MTVRHIVVEGPDGSGKTTLMGELKRRFELGSYPRFSTSLGGPIPELAKRVETATSTLFNAPLPFILDRHPLVSEMVYGPILRGRPVDPHFVDLEWVSCYSQGLMKRCIIVFCIPPLPRVRANVQANIWDQMPGVAEHIDAIYTSYLSIAARWGGPHFIYDYTKPVHVSQLRKYLINEGIK